jgi:hypothetical protein
MHGVMGASHRVRFPLSRDSVKGSCLPLMPLAHQKLAMTALDDVMLGQP